MMVFEWQLRHSLDGNVFTPSLSIRKKTTLKQNDSRRYRNLSETRVISSIGDVIGNRKALKNDSMRLLVEDS